MVWQICSYVFLYPYVMHEIRRQKDVLKNLQNDDFIQIWREILIVLLVSDDVIAICQAVSYTHLTLPTKA